MKHAAAVLLILAGCATGEGPARTADFALRSLDGTTVRGSDLWSAGPVTLVFMTAW
jgi:hypothetical protein